MSDISKAPLGPPLKPITTAQKKKLFLKALRAEGVVTRAALAVSVDPATPYAWRRKDKHFAAAWDQYLDDCLHDIELLAHKAHAVNDPNFAKWILAMRKPNKYNKENVSENDVNIKIEITERPEGPSGSTEDNDNEN